MDEKKQWFVMRDLHRGASVKYMYEELASQGYETYTPTVKIPVKRKLKTVIVDRPYIRDLFFLRSLRSVVEPLITPYSGFQYRYRLGVSPPAPLVVPDKAMDDFIRVNRDGDSPSFIPSEDIPKDSRNRRIRVLGGPLDGVEGLLKTVRGSKFKTLYVELPGVMAVSVVCKFDYIQLLD
ncbi:MAG: transcriptional regulator [Prevotella sp.]